MAGCNINFEGLFSHGFVTIPRQLSLEPGKWFRDLKEYTILLWLIVKANHAQANYHGTMIERGQVVTSHDEIIKVLTPLVQRGEKVTDQQIRTRLKRLEDNGWIAIQSDRQGTIITICDYDYYQGGAKKTNRGNNRGTTEEQPRSNRPEQPKTTTNKKDNINNKDKNEKKESESHGQHPLNYDMIDCDWLFHTHYDLQHDYRDEYCNWDYDSEKKIFVNPDDETETKTWDEVVKPNIHFQIPWDANVAEKFLAHQRLQNWKGIKYQWQLEEKLKMWFLREEDFKKQPNAASRSESHREIPPEQKFVLRM